MKTKFLQRVLWLMIPLLTIFTTNVWGDVTLEFTTGSSDGGQALTNATRAQWMTSATKDLCTIGTVSNSYYYYSKATQYGGPRGIKIGKKSAAGYTIFNLASGSQITSTTIVVEASRFASDKSADLSIAVNGGSLLTAQTLSNADVNIREYTFTFSSTKVTSVKVNASKYMYIKSITIKAAADCSDPTGLNNSSISSTGATLSVTSSSANYDLYYSTSSTAPTSGTSATTTISSGTSKNITGLNYGTKYYYWARHDCGGGSKSDWVAGSGSYFTTTAPAPTSVAAGSLTTIGATLTITDSYSPASYDIYYSTSSTAPVAGTTPTTTSASTTKALTGLTSGQTYYYWVRGHGPDAQSTWVAGTPATFTTVSLTSISVNTAPTKTVYLEGETFDPTGLVITRTYSNSTSDTYTYAGHTGDFSFSPTTATALTTSNTSVTITYGGQSVTQSINVYSVTVQAKDENDDAIAAGGPGSPTFTVATRGITPAADAANYKFWKWTISGAELGSAATTKTNTITNPTGNVTVTAVYYLPRTVTWLVNGEEWKPYTDAGSGTDGTAVVTKGVAWSTLTLPSDPAPPCGDKFVGWTIVDIGSAGQATDAGLDLMTSANKSDKTGAGHNVNDNITFHAVFADYVE